MSGREWSRAHVNGHRKRKIGVLLNRCFSYEGRVTRGVSLLLGSCCIVEEQIQLRSRFVARRRRLRSAGQQQEADRSRGPVFFAPTRPFPPLPAVGGVSGRHPVTSL